MIALQGVITLAALILLLIGAWVIRKQPLYRHHVVPGLGLVAVLLAWLFPINTDVEYRVEARRLTLRRNAELTIDAELASIGMFLACDGLTARMKDAIVHDGKARRRAREYRDVVLQLGADGQWELRGLDPAYVPLRMKYGGQTPAEWTVDVSDAHDGVSLKMPLEALEMEVYLAGFTVLGRKFEVLAGGSRVLEVGETVRKVWIESAGRYPFVLDGAACQKGYLEFVLKKGNEGTPNRLTLTGPPGSLSDPGFGEIQSAEKVTGNRRVSVAGGELKESGQVKKIEGGTVIVENGALKVRVKMATRDRLISRYQGDPLISALAAIIVFWVTQVITFGPKIEIKPPP